MAKVEEGVMIIETKEEAEKILKAIRKEKVDEELLKEASSFRGKSILSSS
ncbi:hypothetical protein [Stygiolobus caldivivus]|uniref:Uncharacterized protein n=1 Tax=Stygiolobus caldivivus TaxID=2824673 RepID=A0A8D5U800_9CREN|nr:hypothetical protein [Stygiolobus caldivivus]BCU70730.1 hypothetical protein KN1_20270 [Stygiolobus caldivivus]